MSKDPSLLLLEHHLKALKLPTLLRDYASLAAVCSQERSSFPQYLLRLVERELIDRERRATERRIKEAAFPVIKTIESFDFSFQPSLLLEGGSSGGTLATLGRGAFQKKNLLLALGHDWGYRRCDGCFRLNRIAELGRRQESIGGHPAVAA